MSTSGRSRTLYAAVLLVAALAVLLVAWFLSGWADVRTRQRELRAGPVRTAEHKAVELSRELRAELARLITRETERPYFHYQNLFHDPRTGARDNVAPSPLASGPADPLVLGYFQRDPAGKLTTPTINDDVPHLSEPKRLAENRRFRDEVVRGFVAELEVKPPELVADAAPVTKQPRPQAARPRPPPAQDVEAAAQVVELDPRSYEQNSFPSRVYWDNYVPVDDAQQQRTAPPQQRANPAPPQRAEPQVQQRANQAPQQRAEPQVQQRRDERAETPAPQPASQQVEQRARPMVQSVEPEPATQEHAAADPQRVEPPRPPRPPRPRATRRRVEVEPPMPPRPVMITISPLEWRTFPYAGAPALVAVRHVDTPDGRLAQGFVIDRATLTGWLANRAGDAVAQLATTGETGATEIAANWHLVVEPNPRALVAAAVGAREVARGFVLRFVLVGVIAALAAMFVVLLVSRAERLARERSQFAAAAAHELRTPLAGLQLYGDMLADGLGDPGKLRDYARRMSEEASRLGRVVSNVLGFSQLERGNLSVEAKPGPLGEVLCELADRAQPALDRAGATLSLDVSPDLAARFDRDALARIVGNLLDNAEKYARGADDRTIGLAAREITDAVEVTVTDHGPGIAAQTRPKLFRPFSRGVTGDGPAGLGLGLALSRSLAQAMGGELEYRAAPGGGAAFVLRLARA